MLKQMVDGGNIVFRFLKSGLIITFTQNWKMARFGLSKIERNIFGFKSRIYGIYFLMRRMTFNQFMAMMKSPKNL